MDKDAHFPRPPGEHDVYLLRVWHESDGERAVWRASVLQGHSPRRYFATPDALLHYLSEHLRDERPVNAPRRRLNRPASPTPGSMLKTP